MIAWVSKVVAAWLEKEGAVSGDDQALFSYAVYSLLFGLTPVLLAAVLGAVLRMLYEGLILIVPFMLIRKFSGGYHLSSPGLCTLASSSLLALALWVTKYLIASGRTVWLSCVTALSVISICLLSPIDSEARRLSDRERHIFRIVARAMALVMLAVYLALTFLGCIHFAIPVGIGITIAAVLQLPCLVGMVRQQAK